MIKLKTNNSEKIDFVAEKHKQIGDFQHVYILKESGIVVVYVSIFEYNPGYYSINYLATNPAYFNQGYAKKALTKLLNILDYQYISLEVRQSNLVAIQLYKSCGFLIKSTIANYYTNPNEDGLEMIIEK
jgi:ribosomal-protein-alanine N-acetyltransferase